LGIERNERSRQRAFTQQLAEEVGDRERDRERRPHRAGAEVVRRDRLAGHAKQPADERDEPDRLRVADEGAGV
jgi:hypothetical protein